MTLLAAFFLSIFFTIHISLQSPEGDLLILPRGKEHSLICVSNNPHGIINWADQEGNIGNRFEVTERDLDDGRRSSNITFNATPAVNQSQLRCIITEFVSPQNLDTSTPINVTIFIQGKLLAPDVMHRKSSNGSIQLTWNPPFSLDITDVEPDIYYYQVTILKSGSTTTINTSDTHFLLESIHCQYHVYRVEIAAVNTVGVGEKYTSPLLHVEGRSVRQLGDPTVSLQGPSPKIIIKVQTSCDRISYESLLMSTSIQEDGSRVQGVIRRGQTDIILPFKHILFNHHYNIMLTIVYGRDYHNDYTHQMLLSTYDVQRVEIEKQGNEYEFRCYFATGSRARGCRIVLRHEVNGECELKAARSERDREAVVMATLANGHYSISVYDIERNRNERQGNPAYTTTLSVSTSFTTQTSGCESLSGSSQMNTRKIEEPNAGVGISATVPTAITLFLVGVVSGILL